MKEWVATLGLARDKTEEVLVWLGEQFSSDDNPIQWIASALTDGLTTIGWMTEKPANALKSLLYFAAPRIAEGLVSGGEAIGDFTYEHGTNLMGGARDRLGEAAYSTFKSTPEALKFVYEQLAFAFAAAPEPEPVVQAAPPPRDDRATPVTRFAQAAGGVLLSGLQKTAQFSYDQLKFAFAPPHDARAPPPLEPQAEAPPEQPVAPPPEDRADREEPPATRPIPHHPPTRTAPRQAPRPDPPEPKQEESNKRKAEGAVPLPGDNRGVGPLLYTPSWKEESDETKQWKERYMRLSVFLPQAGTDVFEEQESVEADKLKIQNLTLGMGTQPENYPLGGSSNKLYIQNLVNTGMKLEAPLQLTPRIYNGGVLTSGTPSGIYTSETFYIPKGLKRLRYTQSL